MVAMSGIFGYSSRLLLICCFVLYAQIGHTFTSSQYVLDTEFSGVNFFEGWDFYTGRDPTGGFVTYYSRSSSELGGLINSSNVAPAYIGVDYVNQLPLTSNGRADGAGRPSVRISSKRSWTHGLFVGDFTHMPSNICGTWPAFWTLGPNWPYTGEIDIMEGVNKAVTNIMSLHSNETCTINGNSTTQLGALGNTNCAYYPDYNVGCGVVDSRQASYSDFNSVNGGVYAMQWTSEYIRIWFFPRDRIPQDIIKQNPDPSAWGLPAANMMGNCDIDRHFQQHKIIFDTTFCGEYAGNPYVWNSTVNSCALDTGFATCDAYVAKYPAAFRDAYWSVNYVRVYQLVDPSSPANQTQYIASLQPTKPAYQTSSATDAALVPTASLCPGYNFTVIQNGGLNYEIECNFDPPGPDLPPPYTNYKVRTLEDCIAGCTYWNTINGTNLCGGVAYDASVPFCYFKKYIDQPPKYRPGFAGARLIYYGYPQITDDPRSSGASSTSTFVEAIPVPQTYRPSTTVPTSSDTFTSFDSTSVSVSVIVPPPLGTTTNATMPSATASGKPTVSFSGTQSIPITNITSSVQASTQTNSLSAQPTSRESSSSAGVEATPTLSGGVSSTRTTVVVVTSSTPFSTSSIAQTPTTMFPSATDSIETLTTKIGPSTSTDQDYPPGPATIASFSYSGCAGSLSGRDVFILSESSSAMTIERCIADCNGYYYAGVNGAECYCVNTRLADDDLLHYPNSACNIPCPGNLTQHCGGVLSSDQTETSDIRIAARQNPLYNDTLTLLTLYSNIDLLQNITATASSAPGSVTTAPQASQSSNLEVTSLSYINGVNVVTVTTITTTWRDLCSTCVGFETTRTTTVVIPCPAEPVTGLLKAEATYLSPVVPMMITTRYCQDCGIGGSALRTTVTIPCEKEIAALTLRASEVAAQAPSLNGPPLLSTGVTMTTEATYYTTGERSSVGNASTLLQFVPPANSTNATASVQTPMTPIASFTGGATRCVIGECKDQIPALAGAIVGLIWAACFF